MRVAGDEDVDVHLPLQDGQRLLVAPRHHLVAVAHAHADVADLHHLGVRVCVCVCVRVCVCVCGCVCTSSMRACAVCLEARVFVHAVMRGN